MTVRKDEILDRLARRGKVSQFVGFEPTTAGRGALGRGRGRTSAPGGKRRTLGQRTKLRARGPRSREFVYGLTDPAEAVATVGRLSADGLHTIVNETVDVADAGSRALSGPCDRVRAFGRPTGSVEVWTRTSPREPEPGLYTTVKGWTDPFGLLAREDAGGQAFVSVLRQDAVPCHSGAAIVTADGGFMVEGRKGEGDGFMLGTDPPEPLPAEVLHRVRDAYERISERLGAVRFEWVDDGRRLWIVQLHVGATGTSRHVIVAGEANRWIDFDARRGLAELRVVLRTLPSGVGILVSDGAGATSHVADVLRKAGAPAQLLA